MGFFLFLLYKAIITDIKHGFYLGIPCLEFLLIAMIVFIIKLQSVGYDYIVECALNK